MKAFILALVVACIAATSPLNAQDKDPPPAVGAGILADQIREGDISPGDTYDLAVGSRFHRIHTRFMAIDCKTCHADVKFPENAQYLRRDEFPLAAYPGAVDRGTCMGCHRGEGALATPFYGAPAK